MIYYVEDENNIRDLVLYALKQAGLEARGFTEAQSFWSACDQEIPHLVLLDIMLPGEDGLTVLNKIRRDKRFDNVPVMMLTAKGAEYDKVLGLDGGADDYLAKPFGVREFIARVRALLRRASASDNSLDGNTIVAGGITLDEGAHTATGDKGPIELTPREF